MERNGMWSKESGNTYLSIKNIYKVIYSIILYINSILK